MLFSKAASFGRELGLFSLKASISSGVRVNTSLGLDIVMSEVEVEVTGASRDLRATTELEGMGWEVVAIGVETRPFFLPFDFESALVL